jgi:AcrR family transcriptional regulator
MVKIRGRPPRLSQDQLVGAALEILEVEGASGVTMSRVAEAVESSPMALYRHVRGRQELLESMLDELLRWLEIDLPEDRPWQDNVRGWMERVRRHFLDHPRILTLLEFESGSYLSPTWIRAVGRLLGPLRTAGFSGEDLAKALQWISRITLGGLLQEIPAPIADTGALISGLGHLDGEEAVQWVDVLPAMERLDDDTFFATTQAETIRVLEGWLASSNAEQP